MSDDPTSNTHTGTHPAITGVLRWFEYRHLPEPMRSVSEAFSDLANLLVMDDPDNPPVNVYGPIEQGPELTVALRKLLEAKDAAVRACIAATTREVSA